MEMKNLLKLLSERDPKPPLNPKGIYIDHFTRTIAELKVEPLVRAGLYLLNDDIDAAHEIAQAHENPDGNYWHAIVHRREGEFGNSKYWYRHVGLHPVMTALREEYAGWDPMEFVGACEKGMRQSEDERKVLEAIQLDEMVLLIEYVRNRESGKR